MGRLRQVVKKEQPKKPVRLSQLPEPLDALHEALHMHGEASLDGPARLSRAELKALLDLIEETQSEIRSMDDRIWSCEHDGADPYE